ncbi:ATP-grasp domain-containing protein [Sporomusa sphaeroides]|uniref:ATP-grasp domain-containing protein n=1 Tax=Sporomusa sphaeroides TaxID=47679 RepID=UPI00202E8B53|nr:ATP-grasp domain-containing protein [Sporomusa sphaeroides]MCM0759193.1 ATP-grasp domain-containing protein [Sporomusa sphaeroides DSM 2875]HML35275.1 ATP-grasp domain-containing protein [Sporomusa sphaeroides]
MFLLVGVSVRALMESAAESGHEVAAIDYFGDQDCRWNGNILPLGEAGLVLSAGNLLQAAETMVFSHSDWRQRYQGLIYAAGPENCPDKLILWEETGLLRGNNATTLRQVRNPWKLSAVLPAGCLMPRFFAPADWRPAKTGAARWLIKPVNSGGGRDIKWLASDNCTAQSQVADLINGKNKYIIQEYIRGVTASATFIADGEQAVIVGTSRQLIQQDGLAPAGFEYGGSIVPLDLPAGIMNKISLELEQVAGCLTRAFGLKGINTLDFIVNPQGIWVLEVNPRWSASVELIERWRGERLFAHHLAAVSEASKWPEGIRRSFRRTIGYWGKQVIYARKKIEVKATDAELRYCYSQGIRDIPVPGTCISVGQPLCTVLAWGKTSAACRRQLIFMAARAELALGSCLVTAFR